MPKNTCQVSHPCISTEKWAGPIGEYAKHWSGGATKDEKGCWVKSGDYKPCVREGHRRECSSDTTAYGHPYSEVYCYNNYNGSICEKYSDKDGGGVKVRVEKLCTKLSDDQMNNVIQNCASVLGGPQYGGP